MKRDNHLDSFRKIAKELEKKGKFLYLSGLSAIDWLLRKPWIPIIECVTDAGLSELAAISEEISFIGTDGIDALITIEGQTLIIHIIQDDEFSVSPIPFLNFFYDPIKYKFLDPFDQYYHIRKGTLDHDEINISRFRGWYDISNLSLILSRYGIDVPEYRFTSLPDSESPEFQRIFLQRLLESGNPADGLTYLRDIGFISVHWPLLESMIGVEQDKDFHPEGDVWDHTLQMFSYTKGKDLTLLLSILLHDCGKAFAQQEDNNRFNRHAQIGADRGRRFLQDLSFDDTLIEDVNFMVRNHMVPSYAFKLSPYKIEDILLSPRYPKLLELFRCDISSSFRSMDIYYKACDHYKQYKKKSRNPYLKNYSNRA